VRVLAIDPGNVESAYVLMDENYKPLEFGKVENGLLLGMTYSTVADAVALEMVASYGMSVGAEVFETVFWIGRYYEAARGSECVYIERILRREVKMNLCHDSRAKDGNIIQALKDRFGDKGTKKAPGFFYGFSKDVWQAFALGVTYLDKAKEGQG
jgi:hypothetical protein